MTGLMPPVGELPLQHNRTWRESRQLRLERVRTPCQRYRWHIYVNGFFKRPTIILCLQFDVRSQIESSTPPYKSLHLKTAEPSNWVKTVPPHRLYLSFIKGVYYISHTQFFAIPLPIKKQLSFKITPKEIMPHNKISPL